MDGDANIILLLVPLVVIQLALWFFALRDLRRRSRVKGGNKWVWVVIIMLGELIGPILYLAVGREEE